MDVPSPVFIVSEHICVILLDLNVTPLFINEFIGVVNYFCSVQQHSHAYIKSFNKIKTSLNNGVVPEKNYQIQYITTPMV